MAISSKSGAKTHGLRRFLLRVFGLLVLVVAGWTAWVVHAINVVGAQDQAQPADAIAVFGAAEYGGRPSPVYHARLDKAVALYDRGIAPLVITFGGGSDKDSGKTEGGVGRDYLLANGVPFDRIVAETRSVDTEEQVDLLAEIARQRGLEHVVVVSDATHLFRIQELCREDGLDVYTSPRAAVGHIDRWDLWMRYWHEVVSYTANLAGIDNDWFHGKD
jgi:uncharacterized SAM-binding protein YcdF (DUF218 family)